MIKRIIILCMMCSLLSAPVHAGGFIKNVRASLSRAFKRNARVSAPIKPRAVPKVTTHTPLEVGVERAVTKAAQTPTLHTEPQAVTSATSTSAGGTAAAPIVLQRTPQRNLFHGRYPSGLLEEEQLIRDWLEFFKNGHFRPRDQVEAIEGMSPKQMNNIIEYLYYLPLEEAQEIILNPLRSTGRLPDFMYANKLIPGTRRLPSGYYKNKFNENIALFLTLAETDGSVFTHNDQLKELISAMKDYSFKQGFTYENSSELTNGLRKNWEALMAEIRKPSMARIRPAVVIKIWNKPVRLHGGKTVSLKQYFSQTRHTAFFEKAMPEFYLNSPKWVALENERRNLIAKEYPFAASDANAFNRLQERLILGNSDKYLTLEQFGALMTSLYEQTYGKARSQIIDEGAVSMQNDPLLGLKAQTPSCTTIKVNNFEKVGGVCQMSFSDGGYMGPVRAGYDGTSTVARFDPVVFDNVRVVTFDMETLQPRVVTLDKVSYVKDLKKPDIDRVRASSMVGDGLDISRDALTVERAEKALRDIPHLRATIYPQSRVSYADKVPYMKGGGLAAYLALFTPDFYPIKTIHLLKKVDGKWTWEPTHFIRKEVLTHAGFIHRDHITFTEQVQERIVPDIK